MAALPNPPLVPVEAYLTASYPDGDREYLDGVVSERNVGTPDHSLLQKILVVYLSGFEKELNIAVRPECRIRIAETRYRVPDIAVMARPFRQSERVALDAPLMIIEIVSPDDRIRDAMQRFREYENMGVRHIIQMDPADRTAVAFVHGDLVRLNDTGFELPGGRLPFDSRALLARLDEE
jgi:Uma2 family endonuclease